MSRTCSTTGAGSGRVARRRVHTRADRCVQQAPCLGPCARAAQTTRSPVAHAHFQSRLALGSAPRTRVAGPRPLAGEIVSHLGFHDRARGSSPRAAGRHGRRRFLGAALLVLLRGSAGHGDRASATAMPRRVTLVSPSLRLHRSWRAPWPGAGVAKAPPPSALRASAELRRRKVCWQGSGCRLPMRSNHGQVRAQSLLHGDDHEAVFPPPVMPTATPCGRRC
jgi:hypothetical protein